MNAQPGIFDEVFAVEADTLECAGSIVLGKRHPSARDAVHFTPMQQQKIRTRMSFDWGFDPHPGMERLR